MCAIAVNLLIRFPLDGTPDLDAHALQLAGPLPPGQDLLARRVQVGERVARPDPLPLVHLLEQRQLFPQQIDPALEMVQLPAGLLGLDDRGIVLL